MAKRQNSVMEAEVTVDFQRVRLADVADVVRGVTYKKDDARSKPESGLVPVLRANNIQDGALELDGELVYVPANLVGKEQLLREGDIVIATSSGSKDLVGKAAPMRTRWMGSFGAFCAAVRPNEDIDPLYLAHFFEGPEYKALIRDKALGVNINNLRRGDLEELAIPLPPLPQQRRIVEAIELQLGRLDAAVARLQGAKARLKRYKQAVLTSATTGNQRSADGSAITPVVIGKPTIAAPKGWQWSLLLDVAKLESGHTPRKTMKEYWDGGDVPWICLQDIREADGTVIMDTKFHPTMMGIDNSSARLLPEGTVVFSRDISVGFVTIMGKVMATTQHFANWICGNKLNNRFLMYALMTSRGPLLHQGQGTTVKTIYMDELQQFHVLHPSIQEQVRIAEEIKSRLDAMAELEATLDAQLQQAVRLRQAVLKRAFEGRLG